MATNWYLFSHRRHGVAAQEWMTKMQTIKKLRVYDQRLDETGVKVISGFEEYGTVIILFDRGVLQNPGRFREIRRRRTAFVVLTKHILLQLK